ncbi:MAG: 5-bromo-4-chloroindolyl phosphate hydrolysis family protein [Oscillospiraceae bacterium]
MSTYNNHYGTPSPGPGPGNPRPNRNNNSGDDFIETLSWIIDVGLIFVWFPVGLFLTIANANGHNFVGSIIRSLRKSFRGTSAQPGYSQVHRTETASSVRRNQQTREREREREREQAREERHREREREREEEREKAENGLRPVDAGAKVKEVFGWILAAFGVLCVINAVGDGLWAILTGVAVLLGGGAMLWSSRKAKRKAAAFKRCLTVSGNTGIVKLEGLAKTLGMSVEELEKQLTEMIDHGYYGERAYIDHARGLLVIQPEDMRYVYQAEDEAKAAGEAAKKEASRTEYEKIIEQIRQADIDIEDEVMSEKIRTMQELTASIFREVEAHPEKKPQIQRFMNYYLPTTLKLLDSYARIEEQGVSGDNMAKAKADIERIADTLVEGYRKQLDTLYQSEAVDIAGDVSVIENMMRRDGLTGHNDFKVSPEDKPGEQGQVMGGR